MNIIKTILATTAATVALISCNEGDNEYHSTYFYPMTNSGIVTYADQTSDTTIVVSTDTWTLTNVCDWCEVKYNGQGSPITVNVPEGYMNGSRLDFTLTPNTTGQLRTNLLQVVSSYSKIGTVAQYIAQYPYIHISDPAPLSSTSGSITTYTFTLTIPASGLAANDTKPYITFTVYDKAATLTSSDESWLVPEKTNGFTTGSSQKVQLDATKNETGSERTATLTLTSNGVTTTVNVKQPA